MTSKKRVRNWLFWSLFAALSIPAALAAGIDSSAEPSVAGAVIHVQGAAFANHRESSGNLSLGTRILVGDHIVTGHNARVGLKMIDGAVLSLGADTEFAVNDYRYQEQAEQGTARLELIKGVFRAVTGAIGKLKERDFKVQTSVGTIGIRGTDFWGGFFFRRHWMSHCSAAKASISKMPPDVSRFLSRGRGPLYIAPTNCRCHRRVGVTRN